MHKSLFVGDRGTFSSCTLLVLSCFKKIKLEENFTAVIIV